MDFSVQENRNIFNIPELRKRILYTTLLLIITRIGMYIPLPGVDKDALYTAFQNSQNTIFGLYNLFSGGAFSRATIFALGIMPYISGSILILLLSGVIPYLKRLRDGLIDENIKFDRFIYLATLLICILQANGIAQFLMSPQMSARIGNQILPVVPNPGICFILMTILTLTTGTMLIIWIANQITEKGIANGIALIILVNIFSGFPNAIISEIDTLRAGEKTFTQEILIIIVFIGLIALTVFIVSAKRNLSLQYIKQSIDKPKVKDWTPQIPFRLNTVGVVPINIAKSIMFIPSTLATFFIGSELIQSIVRRFSINNPLYWIVFCFAIIFLTYLYTAITFNPKDLVKRIKKYGYKIVDMDTNEEEIVEYIDKTVGKRILIGAIFLCFIAIMPLAAVSWLGVHPLLSVFFGPSLLIISAVCIDLREQILAHQKMQIYEKNEDKTTCEWVPVFSGETKIEGKMVKGILNNAGINSIVISNRVISATGTLAFWEASKPTFPSLTIHRRLGNGSVMVKVVSNQVEGSNTILESINIM